MFFLLGCSFPSGEDEIHGSWKLVVITVFNEEVSHQLNPNNDRWIQFLENGTFRSGGGSGENTGTYHYNQRTGALSLDSHAGKGDDSEWQIAFQYDSLIMTGIGTKRQENSQVKAVRMKE